ncbi:MAG: hypothetical protein FDX21_06530 [Chlorobium sp.]|nr:MAG: hypothetical protein FDX21_06530 [Chlorobium sp.]
MKNNRNQEISRSDFFNRRKPVKKNICLAAGIAGIILATASSVVQADGRNHVHGWGGRPSLRLRASYWEWGRPYWGWNGGYLVIDTPPSFIVLPEYGFSVSIGTPYEIIYYDNLYYIYNNNDWYASSFYRGPWAVIQESNLPDIIRKHRIEDIRKTRDIEFHTNANQENRGHRGDINSSKNLNDTHSDRRLNDSEKKDN